GRPGARPRAAARQAGELAARSAGRRSGDAGSVRGRAGYRAVNPPWVLARTSRAIHSTPCSRGMRPIMKALRAGWRSGLNHDRFVRQVGDPPGGDINLTGSDLRNVVPSDRLAIPREGISILRDRAHAMGIAIGGGRGRVVEFPPREDAFLLAS